MAHPHTPPQTASSPSSSTRSNLKTHYTDLPSQWLSSYRTFIRQNASQVSSIESGLHSLTYILPGRFHESPLTSESLYTALTLLTSWHTRILSPTNAEYSRSKLSPQNKYERWCKATGGTVYSRAVSLLRTLQYTQLLCEMFAKRAGDKVRWRVVVLLEFVKAVCRLIIMKVTGNRPVIATGIGSENQERITTPDGGPQDRTAEEVASHDMGISLDDAALNSNAPTHGIPAAPATPPGTPPAAEYHMPRTGLRLPSRLPTSPASSNGSLFPPSETVSEYLSARTLSPDDLRAPPRLVRPLKSTRAQVGEILWILRPVIYALALQQFSSATTSSSSSSHRGRASRAGRSSWQTSWSPILIGLSVDALARHLSKSAVEVDVPGGLKGLSVVERDELKRRGLFAGGGMGWWALRGAFYENVTSRFVRGTADRLRGKPILDMVATVVDDYDWLWSEWYSSTATV